MYVAHPYLAHAPLGERAQSPDRGAEVSLETAIDASTMIAVATRQRECHRRLSFLLFLCWEEVEANVAFT